MYEVLNVASGEVTLSRVPLYEAEAEAAWLWMCGVYARVVPMGWRRRPWRL